MSEVNIPELRASVEAMTPGEWVYRPKLLDDWGMVRAPIVIDGGTQFLAVVCRSRNPDEWSAAHLDRHREAGTDPYEGNGRGIVALKNAAAPLLDELEALRALAVEAQAVLHETGCDGDLCAHAWHERLRKRIAEWRDSTAPKPEQRP